MGETQKYAQLADEMVDLVGGRDNIKLFSHCATRLRLDLRDTKLVNTRKLEKVPGVFGTHFAGDQLQIIIGNSVDDAYRLICAQNGIEERSAVDEDLSAADAAEERKRRFSPARILDAIAGSVTPIIPLLIAVGFLKVFILLLNQFGLLSTDSVTWTVLSFVSDSGFYFLPIYIGANAAKKFGANQGLGMLMGAMLISPTFVQAVTDGQALDIFGLPIYPASYGSTVIPVILIVWVMSYVERFIAKHSPESIRVMTEPFLTLLVMIPLAFCVLGPIGDFLGTYLANAVFWIRDTFGFLSVGLYATFVPWITMTGMHHGLTPYVIQSLDEFGGESFILTSNVVSNLNQGIAALVVGLKEKKDPEYRSVCLSCATTSLLSGISEPTMYGVTLKHLRAMYGAMIGSFFGGCVAGFGGATAHSMGIALGIMGGLPLYLGGPISNLLWMLAGVGVGMAVTFVACWILYKPELDEETEAAA